MERHTETWEELPNTVRTVIEAKTKQLSNGQLHSVGDDTNLHRTHRNTAKHNKAGNR